MRLTPYTATHYAQAIKALLPPGAAWDWPQGGLGATLLHGTAEELARVDRALPDVLERAVETHRPKASSWHIREYRRVANEALAGLAETLPRRPFAVGSLVGQRLWSRAAARCDFVVPLVAVDHLLGPFRVGKGLGSHVGECLWSTRSRYVLRVRYYRSVVDPAPLWAALAAFKQSHVFLWFEDITGVGGNYAPN